MSLRSWESGLEKLRQSLSRQINGETFEIGERAVSNIAAGQRLCRRSPTSRIPKLPDSSSVAPLSVKRIGKVSMVIWSPPILSLNARTSSNGPLQGA
jgi:hypothetical protein